MSGSFMNQVLRWRGTYESLRRLAVPKKSTLNPGHEAPRSGQYEEVGPRGARTGHEVTVPKDRRLPPTSKAGNGYVLVDATKNASGRGK